MPQPIDRLTPKERDALLMLRDGHDAKSIARALDLSVHTVNERLRSARLKLGVSSSREAARMVAADPAAAPPTAPHFIGDKDFGVDPSPVDPHAQAVPHPVAVGTARPYDQRKVIMMFLAAIMLTASVTYAVSQPKPAVAPHVVATTPVAGSQIQPGAVTISVTFDQPMRPDSYSFVQTSQGLYPHCAGRPSVSRDQRTFTMQCHVVAGARYAMGFNVGRFRNFVSAQGRIPATPMLLTFRTSP